MHQAAIKNLVSTVKVSFWARVMPKSAYKAVNALATGSNILAKQTTSL